MGKMKKINIMVSKIITFIKSYIELCIWLLVFAVGIRFFETVLFSKNNFNFPLSALLNTEGLVYDISLYLRIGIFLLIIFVITCFLNEKITRMVTRILLSFMLFLSLIGVLFFTTSGYLLDNAVFSYSFSEIILIIKASSDTPVWGYFVMVGLPVLFFYLSGKKIKVNLVFLILFSLLTISSFFIFNKLSFNTNYYHLKENKTLFFVKSVFKQQSLTNKDNSEDITKQIEEFRSFFPDHQFAETDYPFLYKAIYKDVLSPFLNLNSEPPNFVIVIMEGLGYEHLYNNYHYMQFLDSLSKKSLSWVNCFSVSPRTFGVLPALLGNTPIGVKGFIQQCPYNPEFQSLSKILIENRYTNNFFHGGKSSWIKMDMFSDVNDLIYMNDDEWDQDIQEETAGSEWGYEDHLIYKQALRNINRKNNIPRLDIYLTNTTHSPWKHAKEKDFINSVRSKISQNNKLSDEEKKIILNRLDIYGAYAYSDWSLQQLIEDYQQRDDFKNTIFIITGDHHYNSKQFAGSFNYHVPLVIYSPMLKTSRKMEGVVSHRDITPTILSLLHNNFNIETPDEVAWLNTALDTSIHFNANTFSYLQAAHGTCEGIIYKNYLYSEGVLDELTEKGPQRIENPVPNIVKPLERLLTLYKNVDNYTVLNDALLRKEQSNNLQTTTILDIYDTISMGSYFATRSKLPVLEGPERRKQTLYFDNKKSFPVNFLNYSFSDDDIENLRISIAFKIYILEDTIGEGMNVGLKILKDNETVAYKSDYLNNFQSNSWYDYNYVISFNKDICKQITKGCNFKVYLYNNKCEGYIDDIQVKFLIEKNIDKK